MTRFAALEMATAQGLDLIEVSPMADPPVCRIIDFGKFQFEQNKKTAMREEEAEADSGQGSKVSPWNR